MGPSFPQHSQLIEAPYAVLFRHKDASKIKSSREQFNVPFPPNET